MTETTGADIARAIACGADAVLLDAAVVLGEDSRSDDVLQQLREAMATCGYTNLKDFQKVEVVVG